MKQINTVPSSSCNGFFRMHTEPCSQRAKHLSTSFVPPSQVIDRSRSQQEPTGIFAGERQYSSVPSSKVQKTSFFASPRSSGQYTGEITDAPHPSTAQIPPQRATRELQSQYLQTSSSQHKTWPAQRSYLQSAVRSQNQIANKGSVSELRSARPVQTTQCSEQAAVTASSPRRNPGAPGGRQLEAKSENCASQLKRLLQQWDIPPKVAAAYGIKGLQQLYPWQAAALECGEQGNNLLYCAPTSGGKTVVAEILMIRKLLSSMIQTKQPSGRLKQVYKKALVILPFVALVREKAEHLTEVLQEMNCSVQGYFGSDDLQNSTPLTERGETVAICTIEKANVAINRLIQQSRLDSLCCVIVDELHMVADEHRGLALEMSLTKLVQAKSVQIVGMSATMGGLERVAAWLKARLFITNYRPVSLTEHVVMQGSIYVKERCENPVGPVKRIRELPESTPKDKDRLLPLVAEPVNENSSVLIFCSSRAQTQSSAAFIADHIPALLSQPWTPEVLAKREELISILCLKTEQGQTVLTSLLQQGVAYHHAGMTNEEKEVVEKGFREGCILVLTATSTLAAGINLPARRVILRGLRQGISNMTRAQYLQMVGRAGRKGQTAYGESFLIGSGEAYSPRGEWEQICALLDAPLPVLTSQLLPLPRNRSTDEAAFEAVDTQHLQRLLLEGVANGSIAGEKEAIPALLQSTFLACQASSNKVSLATKQALHDLRSQNLLTFQQAGPNQQAAWAVTEKGAAIYQSALPTSNGEELFNRLKLAMADGVCVWERTHLIYLVLQEHPLQIVNWNVWQHLFRSLPAAKQKAAALLGVSERYILKRLSGGPPLQALSAKHERFAAACVLEELLSERPITRVCLKWTDNGRLTPAGVDKGEVQKLQQNLSKWAAMAALMSASAGWWQFEVLFNSLSAQAAAGARPELLPLLQVESLTADKARLLYNAGVTSIDKLMVCDEAIIAKALAGGLTNRRAPKKDEPSLKVGLTGATGTNAMLAREVKLLLQAAQQTVVKQALELQRLLGDEDVAAQSQQSDFGATATPASQGSLRFSQEQRGSQEHVGGLTSSLRVHIFRDGDNIDQIRQTLRQFSTAASVCISLDLEGDSLHGLAIGIPTCVAFFVVERLDSALVLSDILCTFLSDLMGNPRIYKVFWNMEPQLIRLGKDIHTKMCSVLDLKLASDILWESNEGQDVAAMAKRLGLSSSAVPITGSHRVLRATKECMDLAATSTTVLAMLKKQQAYEEYLKVEVPCSLLAADIAKEPLHFSQQAASSSRDAMHRLLDHLQASIASAGGPKLDYCDPDSYLRLLEQIWPGNPLLSSLAKNPNFLPTFFRQLTIRLSGMLPIHPSTQDQQIRRLCHEAMLLFCQLIGLDHCATSQGFPCSSRMELVDWMGANEFMPSSMQSFNLASTLVTSHVIVPDPGKILVQVDLSRLHLASLGTASGDEVLQQAALVPHPYDHLAQQLRTSTLQWDARAVEACFKAIACGWNDAQLAHHLGIQRSVGIRLQEAFKAKMQKFFAFLDDSWQAALTRGFAQTASGRRIPLDNSRKKVNAGAKASCLAALCQDEVLQAQKQYCLALERALGEESVDQSASQTQACPTAAFTHAMYSTAMQSSTPQISGQLLRHGEIEHAPSQPWVSRQYHDRRDFPKSDPSSHPAANTTSTLMMTQPESLRRGQQSHGWPLENGASVSQKSSGASGAKAPVGSIGTPFCLSSNGSESSPGPGNLMARGHSCIVMVSGNLAFISCPEASVKSALGIANQTAATLVLLKERECHFLAPAWLPAI